MVNFTGLVRAPSGPWDPREDHALRTAMDRMDASGEKRSWTKAAALADTGRSPKQCRERWMNHLRPGLRFDEWTEEEERSVLALYNVHGSSWAKIAAGLVGRTDCQVKNLFHTRLKGARPLTKPPEEPKEEPKGALVDCPIDVDFSFDSILGLGDVPHVSAEYGAPPSPSAMAMLVHSSLANWTVPDPPVARGSFTCTKRLVQAEIPFVSTKRVCIGEVGNGDKFAAINAMIAAPPPNPVRLTGALVLNARLVR